MKKITLSTILILLSLAGYSTTWTITNSGFTFTPATITITSGDDVNFNIASIHQVVEVSEATWNANNNTHLDGGFETDLGGGMVSASELTVGTHWYVCFPHAFMGMKGKIIVQATTGTKETELYKGFTIYPNPSNGKFNLEMANSPGSSHYDLEIFDITGKIINAAYKLEHQRNREIDLTGFVKGVYFIRIIDGTEIYTRKVIVN